MYRVMAWLTTIPYVALHGNSVWCVQAFYQTLHLVNATSILIAFYIWSLPPPSPLFPSLTLLPSFPLSCSPVPLHSTHAHTHTHTHIHTIQLIEALESFVSGTRTRLRKMMMKKREKESLTYVNVKPRNASMAVEVSGTNSFSTTYCELHTAFE